MSAARQSVQYECSTNREVESVAFLTEMLALLPALVYVFNHQTMSNEYANCCVAEMLGYAPEDIKAMGENLLPTIVHPDDFDLLAEHVGSLQTLGAGEYATWEYRALRADGEVVWLRSVEAVFSRAADGSVLRHIGIAFDISAEKCEIAQLQAEISDLKRALHRGGTPCRNA